MGSRAFASSVLLVVVAVMGSALPALADSTGFASAHAWRKERGKTCLADHWHYGTGNTMRTKKQALRDAIASWQGFTDFEYGSDWARWSRAVSKKSSCKRSSGGWDCSVEARPCHYRR